MFDVRAKFDETLDKIPERKTFKTISIIKQSIGSTLDDFRASHRDQNIILKEEIESSINYLYNFRSLSHYRYSTGGGIGREERRRKGRRDDGEDDLFTRNVGFSAWTVRLARKSRKEEGTIRRKRRRRKEGGQGDVSVARKEKTFFGRSRGISLHYHPLSLPLSIPFLRVPRQSP